jgi:AcrR family transcriptional regulator
MGPKERREREREEMRDRILDAARELFASEGYEAVTMRRIAQKIEYSATALYAHFADKERLLGALCAADFATLAADLARIARIKDPIERLRKVGHAYIEFGLTHPNHYRIMFMTPHPAIEHEDEELEKRGNPEQDAYAFLMSIVAEAIETKRFAAEYREPELVSQTIWAGVHGVIALEIAKANDAWITWRPLKKRAHAMVELLIRALTGK